MSKAVEATEHVTRTFQIFAAIGTSSSKRKGLLKEIQDLTTGAIPATVDPYA